MSKLEVIDGKQTNWGGLWWHPENNCFSSQAINLSELRKFKGQVRIYIKKNKFYNNGENGRPNYHFILRDAKSDTCFNLSVCDMEEDDDKTPYQEDGVYYTEDGDRLYTRDEVRVIMDGTFRDAKEGVSDPWDILPEDFV